MKKVCNYENKKIFIIVKENNTPENMTEQQRHEKRKKLKQRKALKKSSICYEENKERQHRGLSEEEKSLHKK